MLFEGFKRRECKLDDVTINYVIGGNGPPVLLLHGFPQNLSMWAHIAPKLAEHYTVICADLRGYGDSSKPKAIADHSNYSFRAMANDNVTLMQQEGFNQFHIIGHDRGGRTAHRLALDHESSVLSLAVLDIVPTHAMFMETNHKVSGAYWHWYYLSQAAPFPEKMITADPDFFYETCLLGWGATNVEDFDQEQLADYRRCWRDPEMIHGSCSDYRAAATIDLALDQADINKKVSCPTLVFYGANGTMANCFDLPATWRKRCEEIEVATLPGGHFFVDEFPTETNEILLDFLKKNEKPEGLRS